MLTNVPKFPFYHGLSQLPGLSHSFGRKLLLVVSLGFLLPPLGLLISFPELRTGSVILVMVVISVFSLALVALFFLALLSPLQVTGSMLRQFLEEHEPPELPMTYCDAVGELMRDVQYLTQKQHLLESNNNRDSSRDPLTGLLNRQGATERLRQDLSRAHREQVSLLLLMLDIEGFEGVTGAFGYKMGEVCLIRTADLLLHSIRSGDWAARWDGDCFLVTLWNFDDSSPQRIIKRLQYLTIETLEGEQLSLPLTVGVWRYQGEGDLTLVLSCIQEALAKARSQSSSLQHPPMA